MGKLSGKYALIIGGSSGIGLATAKCFAHEGADVVITGRDESKLKAAVGAIGPQATGIVSDLSKIYDLDTLYKSIYDSGRNIDVLFVCAGVGHINQFLPDISEQLFHDTFVSNVKNVIFAVQKAVPLMNNGGSIILNSSIAHLKALPGMSVYSASKAAVRSFTRTWAMELKDRNIRVNTISPGPVETPFTDPAPQAWKEMMTAAVPLGRFGRPEELASAVLFLASEDASYITGIDLCVDGGLTQV
ncbi:SDR family NAD(P)-dependent oxidoreductase [Cedecea sp. NFIX57]|uniref:SDR family NAD(P)-dependent oxidoreductase n=1 Tax=Cedecea sp. NFIX57 TaxID=1566286 RepID=UPI000A0DC73B|nr:SDR family oxidoreductase [Cedecea sp. NFIX57]SMG32707.1 NAD(P)-dependent dehydrogenase, short-chain alcohol dehydrogenase family [Cedecea sp. NFIX57]